MMTYIKIGVRWAALVTLLLGWTGIVLGSSWGANLYQVELVDLIDELGNEQNPTGKLTPVRADKVPVDTIIKFMTNHSGSYYFMFPPFERHFTFRDSSIIKEYSLEFFLGGSAPVGFVNLDGSVNRVYERKESTDRKTETSFYVGTSYDVVTADNRTLKCDAKNQIKVDEKSGKIIETDSPLSLDSIIDKDTFFPYIEAKYKNDDRKHFCKSIPITFNCVVSHEINIKKSSETGYKLGAQIGIPNIVRGGVIGGYKEKDEVSESVEVDSVSGYYPVPYSFVYIDASTKLPVTRHVKSKQDIEFFCQQFMFPIKEERIAKLINEERLEYIADVELRPISCEDDRDCNWQFEDQRSWPIQQIVGPIGTVYNKCQEMTINSTVKFNQASYQTEKPLRKKVCQFRSSRGSKCSNLANGLYPPCLNIPGYENECVMEETRLSYAPGQYLEVPYEDPNKFGFCREKK
jgi:hypothetical protein